MKDYLVLAIKSLRPSCEFTLQNDDYATIEFHVLEGDAPTQSEIDAEITRLKKAESDAAKAETKAKAALLDRLGITAEEAALLVK
jgi:hypothetical protein